MKKLLSFLSILFLICNASQIYAQEPAGAIPQPYSYKYNYFPNYVRVDAGLMFPNRDTTEYTLIAPGITHYQGKFFLFSTYTGAWYKINTGSGGGGGGGISEVVSNFGLISVNDSTLKVDSNILATALRLIKVRDSLQININAKLNSSDTSGKWIRRIENNGSNDSIIFYIGSTRYAIKDNGSGGSGTNNLNVGSGFKIIKEGTQEAKSLVADDRVQLDSATANVIKIKSIDSSQTVSAKNIADLRANSYHVVTAKKKGSNDKPMITVQGYYNPMDAAGIMKYWWDDTCTHADNGGTFILPTGHSGAGRWRLLYDPAAFINACWFGLKADGITDNYPKWLELKKWLHETATRHDPYIPTYPYFRQWQKLYFPPSETYYLFGRQFIVDENAHIAGASTDHNFHTRFSFPDSVMGVGLYYQYDTSSGKEVGANGIIVENIHLYQKDSTSTTRTLHGWDVGTRVTMRNCGAENFGGNGFNVIGDGTLRHYNCDLSQIDHCYSYNCYNGLYISGGDGNLINISRFDGRTNVRWGIWDRGFLGNHYEDCHTTSNGITFNNKTLCEHPASSGNYYYAKYEGTLPEPGVAVGWQDYWGVAGPWGYMKPWTALTTWEPGGSYAIDKQEGGSENAPSLIAACYSEGGQAPAYIGSQSLVLQGDHGAGIWHGTILGVANSKLYTNNRMMSWHPVSDWQSFIDVSGHAIGVGNLTSTSGFAHRWDTTYKYHYFGSYGGYPGASTGWNGPYFGTSETVSSVFNRSTNDLTGSILSSSIFLNDLNNTTEWPKISMTSAKPTTGYYKAGDIALYKGTDSTLIGWKAITTGNPATFAEMRYTVYGSSGGVTTVGTFTNSVRVNGADISGSTITFGVADPTNAGMVAPYDQIWTGEKTLRANHSIFQNTATTGTLTVGFPSAAAELQWSTDGYLKSANAAHLYFGRQSAITMKVDGSNDGVTIGSGYVGSSAPAAGLIVEGKLGVGTSSPAASSIMDVSSTTKSFLPPRMTAAQRIAISSPAAGSLVYDIDSAALFYYNTAWHALLGSHLDQTGGGGSSALSALTAGIASNTINSGNNDQTWQWNTLGGKAGFNITSNSTAASGNAQVLVSIGLSGANATSSQTTSALSVSNSHTGTGSTNVGISASASGGDTNNYGVYSESTGQGNIAGYFNANSGSDNLAIIVPNGGGRVGIGTSTPSIYAALDLGDNDKGFLGNRLNSTQQAAFISPPNGLMIFNTDSVRYMVKTASGFKGLKYTDEGGGGGSDGNGIYSGDGSLPGNVTVTAGTNTLVVTGTGSAATFQGIKSTGGGQAIYGLNDGTGIGVEGKATGGGIGVHSKTQNATTNTLSPILDLTLITTATPANNIGGYVRLNLPTGASATNEAARLAIKRTDVTGSSEDDDFEFYSKRAGTITKQAAFTSLGQLVIPTYVNSSSFPVTPAGMLVYDASGNVGTQANLVIGTNVQAYDADLSTWAGITPTTVGQNIVQLTNPSATGYIRTNADNTITHRSYSNVKVDLSLDNVDNTSDATKNSATATLTNKRINQRITSISSNATWSPNADTDDIYEITAQGVAATTISNPSGTPVNGQFLEFVIKDDGSARALTWSGTNYRASTTLAFPTTTTAGKLMRVKVQYTTVGGVTKWDLVSVLDGF